MKKTEPTPGPRRKRRPTQADYEALSEFRYLIRCFLEFSENAARAVGLAPAQHQALLAIRGHAGPTPIAIGDLAERLRIKHHTAVELIDRLATAKLVKRVVDPRDQRRVLLELTPKAEDHLSELSAVHLDELSRIESQLTPIFARKSK